MDRRKRYLKRVGQATAVLLLNEEDAERYHPNAILLDEKDTDTEETLTDDDSAITEGDSSLTETSEENSDEEPAEEPAEKPAPKKTTRKK